MLGSGGLGDEHRHRVLEALFEFGSHQVEFEHVDEPFESVLDVFAIAIEEIGLPQHDNELYLLDLLEDSL